MRQTELRLRKQEREVVEGIRSKGSTWRVRLTVPTFWLPLSARFRNP